MQACDAPDRRSVFKARSAGSSVTLAWQRGTGNIARYVLEAGSAAGLRNIASLSLAPAPTTFAAAATPGTYFVRIRAANSCGIGPPSTEVSLVVGSGSELPGPPGTPSARSDRIDRVALLDAARPRQRSDRVPPRGRHVPGLANAALVTLGTTPPTPPRGVPRGYLLRAGSGDEPGRSGSAVCRRDGDSALNGPVHTPSPLRGGVRPPVRDSAAALVVGLIHRWVSIAFSVTVVANFVPLAQGTGMPPPWVTYSPLLPLAFLMFTGLYLFASPYPIKWRGRAS